MVNYIIVYTKQGLYKFDIQQVFKTKLNLMLEGWYCSTIHSHMSILMNNQVISSSCRNFILCEDIFDQSSPFDVPEKLICQQKMGCHCESDINVPKAIDFETCEDMLNEIMTVRNHRDLPEFQGDVKEIIGMTTWYYAVHNLVHIVYGLGKKCNFDCSYCEPHTHDNFSPFKTYDELMGALVRVEENVNLGGRNKKITLTGGEPTLFKEIIPFSRELLDKGYEVYITTNGTASYKTYDTLLSNGIIIEVTFHPEFTTDKIIKKIEKLREKYFFNVKSMDYDNPQYQQAIKDKYRFFDDVQHKVIIDKVTENENTVSAIW